MVKWGVDFIDGKLTLEEIEKLQKKYGDYFKLTVDIENAWIVAGVMLHADGEKILLGKGSAQDNIWGGGINIPDKIIDATAVLNLRPRLGNDSMEILDPARREKLMKVVKDCFSILWQ